MKEKKSVDIRSKFRLCLSRCKNLFLRVKKNNKTESNSDVCGAEKELVSCLNCGCEYHGAYCPQCGQEADTERFTVGNVARNMFEALIGGDSVFLRTCGQLLCRPGRMVHDFLVGKRTRYFKPVQMLICLVTIYALLKYALGDFITISVNDRLVFDEENTVVALSKASKLLSDFFSNRVFYTLVSSLVCLFPFQLLFRKCKILWPDGERRRLNTAEQFCTQVYLSCQNLICCFLLLPFRSISAIVPIINATEYVLPCLLYVWTFRQLYEIGWWKSMWKIVVAMFLSTLLLLAVLLAYFALSLLIVGVDVKA